MPRRPWEQRGACFLLCGVDNQGGSQFIALGSRQSQIPSRPGNNAVQAIRASSLGSMCSGRVVHQRCVRGPWFHGARSASRHAVCGATRGSDALLALNMLANVFVVAGEKPEL